MSLGLSAPGPIPCPVLLGSLLMLCACAISPATGRPIFTGVITTEHEAAIGRREHPQVVKAFGGAYDASALQAYVNDVGQRVARASDRTDVTYTFTILNSPIVNALAMPGGYVYVTRGVLALADSEAELAGLLSHEIGHVAARHHAQALARETLAQIGMIALGATVGEPLILRGTQILALGYLRAFSRSEELEADQLGVSYITRAGYDPAAMARFLGKLRANEQLNARMRGLPPDRVDQFDYTATHPSPLERWREALEAAKERPVREPVVGRENYLKKIDGLLYGDDASSGFVRGRTFAHPVLKFSFEFPPDFQPFNTPERVYALGPGSSLLAFDLATEEVSVPLDEYLTARWARGTRLSDVRRTTIGGLEAATARTLLSTSRGRMNVRIAAIRRNPKQVFRFRIETPPALEEILGSQAEQAIKSFRTLSDKEAAALKPLRVRVIAVKQGDTATSLALRSAFPAYRLERFQILNGLAPDERLTPGRLLKIVSE